MRIAIFTDSYLPFISGVTVAVKNQTRELVSRGHEVTVFCPKPWRQKRAQRELAGKRTEARTEHLAFSIPVWWMDGLYVNVPAVIPTIRTLRRVRPDVVHVNTEWGCGWDGLLASRYLGLPVVGTFHTFFADPGYLKAFGLPQHWLFEKLIWNYSRFFYDRCDVTTAPSKAVRDALVANGAAMPPQVVSNGIPQLADRSGCDVSAFRKQHGLEGPTFVYVGRVSPEKSLEVVLAAFRRVVARFPQARFLLVGDGPERTPLTRLMQRMEIADHVVQLGHVPHEDLIARSIPRWGDVFVTASKTENQPISILEALSFGVPVIGARSKGIPELIDEGVNGLLFEPDNERDLANKMLTLAGDLPLCRQLGEGARTGIQQHTISHTVDRLLGVYEQAIRQREKPDAVTQRPGAVRDNPAFAERALRARTPE